LKIISQNNSAFVQQKFHKKARGKREKTAEFRKISGNGAQAGAIHGNKKRENMDST
jgi:hypothetical protein